MGDPIRILHVVQSLGFGGMESRIARLSKGLPRDTHTLEVLSLRPAEKGTVELAPGTPHHHFPIPSGLHPGILFKLADFIRKGRYDVVHTHNWSSMFYGVAAGRLAGTPLVLHGEHGLNRSDLKGTPWKRLYAQRALARAAHWLVPVNEPIAAHVRKAWRLDNRRITVIPNGVDLARFRPSPPPAEGFVVGMVGRLDDVKDVGTALLAVRALLDRGEGDGLRLVLVGDGPMRAALEAQASSLGIAGLVEFAGARSDVESWYGRFHAQLNASVYEGMCNTLLEAMACGLPLIASAVPGNQAWLREGVDARFFPAGDANALAEAILAMRRDPQARAAMGAHNRTRAAAEYDNSGFIAAYVNLYERLLKGRRRP